MPEKRSPSFQVDTGLTPRKDTIPATRIAGLKQVRRAIEAGRARTVWIAVDADPKMIDPIRVLCAEKGVCTETGGSMRELGRACGIAVGTAVAALVANG